MVYNGKPKPHEDGWFGGTPTLGNHRNSSLLMAGWINPNSWQTINIDPNGFASTVPAKGFTTLPRHCCQACAAMLALSWDIRPGNVRKPMTCYFPEIQYWLSLKNCVSPNHGLSSFSLPKMASFWVPLHFQTKPLYFGHLWAMIV